MDMDVFVPEFIRKSWTELEMESLCGPGPRWIDRAGDLVVVDGDLNWSTPECADSGIDSFEVRPGVYPVYAGSVGLGEDPGQSRHYVTTLFVALAAADELADSTWDFDESSALRIDGYACLWSDRAERNMPVESFVRFKESTLSTGVLSRRGPWIDEVTDPGSGANVMVFPVADNSVSTLKALNENGELLALLYLTWSP
ncbi:hypothetical protein [Streptomyces sp. NBC_00872]|uniref:hypothetical protein n=1 Tax=Streptomyces sp. NBC_00872 TaxID=2903686 RepID=UPI00386F2D39|nr:hypothetical protein OG214_07590 [Streptomyces sp. NBC_00872]